MQAALQRPLKSQSETRSTLLPRARNLRSVLAHGAVKDAEIRALSKCSAPALNVVAVIAMPEES